ncbi:ribonuclease E/G [Serinibacter arcticus]|uniref:Ribonuclease E n=1 Tax=Serinibacter arcticus TaxID=1655435 RepID=A0A2U1ZR20_9MICO|nr:Rne/Rng family ribonuclease [Serinibacter arcticus]PWD49416.1 ribonuclease E/G [Serinibacter arcticus]
MALDNDSNATSVSGETPAAEKPKRRAPRRATRGVVTPDEKAAAAETAPAAPPAPAAEPAPAQAPAETSAPADVPPAAPTTRKRAPRRASTASVVTPAEAPAEPVVAAEPAAPAVEEPAAEPAPKTRTRKSRAKAPVEPTAEVATEAAPEPTPADAEPAAPVKKPRKSRAKKVVAEEAPAETAQATETVQADEPAPADEPAESTSFSPVSPFSATRVAPAPERDPEQRIDVLAAFGLGTAPAAPAAPAAVDADDELDEDEDAASDEEATEEVAPRLPATALLFQPPAPARRRRRRTEDAEETTEASVEAPAVDAEPEPESDAPASARGRGRRSGRRGGRRTDAVEQAEPEEETEVAEPVEDGAEDQESDENEGAEGTDGERDQARRRRRRGGRGRKRPATEDADGETDGAERESAGEAESDDDDDTEQPEGTDGGEDGSGSSRRRRRRRGRRGDSASDGAAPAPARARDEVTALKGSTRLEAKRLRRREGRDAGRRRQIITEAEFLARRESVQRDMVVRERAGMMQIAVMEDGVLVEHYVAQEKQTSMVGNVYLGRVQNVLPSMEAAFVDLGKGRNAVLYAGEVNWEAAGLDGQPRRIEQALKSGDQILVQVTKDPIGHKGARLTSQITLAGRYLVLVPSGAMTGISRKLPENERARLKKLLKEIVPAGQGVIVRTAAEGASEEELRRDVERLTGEWADISARTAGKKVSAPALLKGEPELALRVVRDVFNEDFSSLTVAGNGAWETISGYVAAVAPDLAERLHHWAGPEDVFASKRIDEQLAKGMDRKVWLPSGGSLVIDRTEAMTVVDVNTGKFTGSGGTLEETVTRNNIEAAEEIVRQLRLRDIGGIIVVDFIDMVLESNRDLVLRRLIECLGRDRTRHQVAEVTSLGLVQMTRKRVGQGLVEAFSTPCEHCHGRGFMVSSQPHAHVEDEVEVEETEAPRGRGRGRGRSASRPTVTTPAPVTPPVEVDPAAREAVKATLAQIAAAAQHAHDHDHEHDAAEAGSEPSADVAEAVAVAEAEVETVEDDATLDEAPVEVADAADVDATENDSAEDEQATTEDTPSA